MTFLELAAIGLASWRVSSLLVQESGPGGVFLRVREWLGIEHTDGLPTSWSGEGLAALFSCVWCMSLWMAGLMYLIWWLSPIPIWILAASALAILAQESIERLKQ